MLSINLFLELRFIALIVQVLSARFFGMDSDSLDEALGVVSGVGQRRGHAPPRDYAAHCQMIRDRRGLCPRRAKAPDAARTAAAQRLEDILPSYGELRCKRPA